MADKVITVVRSTGDEPVVVLGLPQKGVSLQHVLDETGYQEVWTESGAERVVDDDRLGELIGDKGCKMLLRGGGLDDVQRNEIEFLRRTVDRLRDEKMGIFSQLQDQDRELIQQRHRIQELEKQCLLGEIGDNTTTSPLMSPVLAACPTDAPPPTPLSFCPQVSGAGLLFENGNMRATSPHSYNKIALTAPPLSSGVPQYAEFVLTKPFSRYTTVGVLLEDGLPRLNPSTDSLGEHDFSFGWLSHEYWSGSFATKGVSHGPKGGEWKVGSRIGVLVDAGAVSFYLDGKLRHQHAFKGITGSFRFGVGFGGPKASAEGDYGTVEIVAGDPLSLE